MLPVGILDGGRFSYLFILSIVKSEKKANKIYKFILSTVGLIFLLIVFGWLFAKYF
jgi:membrane-associated protease RseP (regulator of RpoE activity)